MLHHGNAPSRCRKGDCNQSFAVANWFKWILDARDAGFSKADIRFVLETVGVREDMIRVLQAGAAKQVLP